MARKEKDRLVIRKSNRKATAVAAAGALAGVAGGLVLYTGGDSVLGWCLIITAILAVLYGFGSMFDRRPYIIITPQGITETFSIREQIEWSAILQADDLFFRGAYFIRLLLDPAYKAQTIGSGWFWRFDRIYESMGVKAVYIRTLGLEIGTQRLLALIREMMKADEQGRIEIIERYRGRIAPRR